MGMIIAAAWAGGVMPIVVVIMFVIVRMGMVVPMGPVRFLAA